MEQHVSEIVKWFVTMLLVLLLVSIASLGKQINDVNAFKQYVSASIERNGGYTSEADKEIKNHSKEMYRNYFSVQNVSHMGKVSFGEMIDYEIQAAIPVVFFDVVDLKVEFEGSAISKVR